MDPASASFGRVTVGRPTSVTITLNNPTGTDQTFSVSTTKFTPRRSGTVPSVSMLDLKLGDTAITVPASVTPGQRFDDAHGDRRAAGLQCRAGSILMVSSTTTCISRITRKSS
ncbi:MAG: hypothetical protein Udaeo2_05240 [Candidatus Udaeobacter sp.]|nr:MAG: hypothetical protein Udaeo2_05240 [Candidatus Udaeobacter sp.]